MTSPVQVLRTVFYTIALFGLTGVLNAVQILSLPIALFSERTMYELNSKLVRIVWITMQLIFERVNQGRITFSGHKLPRGESAFVISNHLSWADFYLLHSLSIRRGMIGYCRYFVKDSLKWLPFYGWGMWIMGMIFLKRDWQRDQRKINLAFGQIRRLNPPIQLISFLEGSRATPKKLHESQLYAKSHDLPVLKNVLLPRTKGFISTVKALRGTNIKHVYDFTIAYKHETLGFGHPPSVQRVHQPRISPEYECHVHVRRYSVDELPQDDAGLNQWVRDRFVEKDALLEQMRTAWPKEGDDFDGTEVYTEALKF
ncbi:uncharacterized protein VTP21DRAFT_3101 [Calcarisporiella thermophila]|uniref:uncharacterized protein n=1 Tax=Calcarisporiella thermophila TaxID=911321 RepID=UPI00374337A4